MTALGNGIKIDGKKFHELPQNEKDELLFDNLEKAVNDISKVKEMLKSRWKINMTITGICSFFGGFSAYFIGAYFEWYPWIQVVEKVVK